MQITLKPQTQRFIEEQVKAGRFASAEEVLEAGVARLMSEPEPNEMDDETLAAIEESEDQFERGERIPLEQAAAELRQRYVDILDAEDRGAIGESLSQIETGEVIDARTFGTELKQKYPLKRG